MAGKLSRTPRLYLDPEQNPIPLIDGLAVSEAYNPENNPHQTSPRDYNAKLDCDSRSDQAEQDDASTEKLIQISAEHSHYLIRVLRLQKDCDVTIFDGRLYTETSVARENDTKTRPKDSGLQQATYGEYQTRIKVADKRACVLEILSFTQTYSLPDTKFTALLGTTKGDRLDWALQKSVELGASSIVLMPCSRSQIKLSEAKRENLQGIVRSACEQSGRCELPSFAIAPSFEAAIEGIRSNRATRHGYCFFDHRARQSLGSWCRSFAGKQQASTPSLPAYVAFATGPEGGFTDDERSQLEESNFTAVRLGPRVLRAETAPVAALSVLQHELGDFT